LEIANPIRNAEVAEVSDGNKFAAANVVEGEIGEFPVKFVRREKRAV